jgi:hypothetical protein
MSRDWKPDKKTVELRAAARPSRIRREPVQSVAPSPGHRAWWATREWEIRFAVIGIILFTLAINALLFGVSQVTSK